MSFCRASLSLSSALASTPALSRSPRRKKGTHRQLEVERIRTGEGVVGGQAGGGGDGADSLRPGGQTGWLPSGQDPAMEQTWRNPEGHEDPPEVPEPAPVTGSDAGEVGVVLVVVWGTAVTSFNVTLPFFTTKSKV